MSTKLSSKYKRGKQDTLVTITKLKVSPGTCLATYGDSCSMFISFLGSSKNLLRLLSKVGKGEPNGSCLICILGKHIYQPVLRCRHMTQVSLAIQLPLLFIVCNTAGHSTLCSYRVDVRQTILMSEEEVEGSCARFQSQKHPQKCFIFCTFQLRQCVSSFIFLS